MRNLLPLVLLLSVFAITGSPQTGEVDEHRFEIGGQVTVLNRADANAGLEALRRLLGTPAGSPAKVKEFGIGARFGYNVTRDLSFEVEANVFPVDKRAGFVVGQPLAVSEPGGRKLQVVAGPKIGLRRDRFGIFAKLRPGLIGLDRYEGVDQLGTPGNPFALSSVRRGVYFFNLDVGGVAEYYPTKRTLLRLDVGDTWIRYSAQEPKRINPTISRHNLQVSGGFAFRF